MATSRNFSDRSQCKIFKFSNLAKSFSGIADTLKLLLQCFVIFSSISDSLCGQSSDFLSFDVNFRKLLDGELRQNLTYFSVEDSKSLSSPPRQP
jgi:hypothetical protein